MFLLSVGKEKRNDRIDQLQLDERGTHAFPLGGRSMTKLIMRLPIIRGEYLEEAFDLTWGTSLQQGGEKGVITGPESCQLGQFQMREIARTDP